MPLPQKPALPLKPPNNGFLLQKAPESSPRYKHSRGNGRQAPKTFLYRHRLCRLVMQNSVRRNSEQGLQQRQFL